jgi:diguanylate cyclase
MFETYLQQTIARVGPFDEPISAFICQIDRLDKFKEQWGDRVRDQLLELVARALTEETSLDGGATRVSAEKFAIILGYRSTGEAAEVAEKVRGSIQGRTLIRKSTRELLDKVTVSIGVAQFADGERPVDLVLRAEACLELARQLGGNIVIADTDPLFTEADIDAA